ncbi:hypothetical protein GobsT_52370 [Gemmata obscuriglobus]|uniref:DUF1553 domain-containing protein n=1 Tax=Gemmata obscuriglobus TaxID=114 RepID=A0A2Z3GSZ5_9BACT|nr:DUF1553 domain-containing protein [Gemmata obscuriglobus]AWM36893.1 DUF1553 domain-containing protein [Gemmata obscuriglobus]QEG30432.1 hypothetical protein GobsT_52370 [Gemmata obscuriglobus]VTS09756.1 Uncharacterized protein OS=Singulisphaera acidiphila (strain ATCC BAA-1392 / DSM 18658 / VKM B-2454 / MOB10) GN=Sinac_3967 PE=4 SV=1: PSCyt2: PSD1: PSD5 [Gemmata obscuriglobus UQM 2246]
MPAHLRAAVFVAALCFPRAGSAAEPAPAPRPARDPADAIAALIDAQLAKDWEARGIVPADRADDGEFVRRVYLDLIGRAPKAAEAREFLDSPAPDKRARLVEHLLTAPGHANHFAAVTRAQWLPQAATNFQLAQFGNQFEVWLRDRYRENTPADETVRRLLTVGIAVNNQNPRFRFVQPVSGNAEAAMIVGFYSANEGKPEALGAAVSRLFLGMKLECAQCHDHPFAPYTRDQFWQFAAFFGELNPLGGPRPGFVGPLPPQGDRNTIGVMGTERTVTAAFVDGSAPEWSADKTPRQELADWLATAKNPYFAKNMANRMWAHFFGIGLTDPVDEPGENNPPSHPELLKELGRAFAGCGFDTRVLIRGLVRSKAYQLTSKMSHPGQADPRRFARMNMKGLSPAQLFDTLVAATGFREPAFMRAQQNNGFVQPNNPRSEFLAQFASSERATETNTTILQSLMLMNGKFIGDQTDLAKSELLAAIADRPGWSTEQRVSNLFLTAFSRPPTPAELERFTSYVERGGAKNDKQQALADVFWVLLNSPEFLFNH